MKGETKQNNQDFDNKMDLNDKRERTKIKDDSKFFGNFPLIESNQKRHHICRRNINRLSYK